MSPPPDPNPPQPLSFFFFLTTISIVLAHWFTQTKTDCKSSSGSESLGCRCCVCSFSTVSDERDSFALRAWVNLYVAFHWGVSHARFFDWLARSGLSIDSVELLVADASRVYVLVLRACLYFIQISNSVLNHWLVRLLTETSQEVELSVASMLAPACSEQSVVC